jgi:hypothetical protein
MLRNIGTLLLAGGFPLLSSAIYIVPPGFRAIIFDRFGGLQKEPKGVGVHLRIPVLQVLFQYFNIRNDLSFMKLELDLLPYKLKLELKVYKFSNIFNNRYANC